MPKLSGFFVVQGLASAVGVQEGVFLARKEFDADKEYMEFLSRLVDYVADDFQKIYYPDRQLDGHKVELIAVRTMDEFVTLFSHEGMGVSKARWRA